MLANALHQTSNFVAGNSISGRSFGHELGAFGKVRSRQARYQNLLTFIQKVRSGLSSCGLELDLNCRFFSRVEAL